MKSMSYTKRITFSAMFLALGLVLPFITGQIPQIGSMLCPMHIPVLLCGFFCGGSWGLAVGLIVPILRSMLFTMPHMFPNAVCMALELATYGWVAGCIYNKLPKKTINIYATLFCAMLAGRLVWGAAMFACVGMSGGEFGLAAFWTAAVVNAIPGIVIQIILIPIIVMAMNRQQRQE